MFLDIRYSQKWSRDSRGSCQGGIKLLGQGLRCLCMYEWVDSFFLRNVGVVRCLHDFLC